MNTTKRSASRRISVWVLIFALILTTLSSAFSISAHAKNSVVGEIGDAAKEATSDVGDAVKDAADQVTEHKNDGDVKDSDGMIGNEKDEASADTSMDEGRKIGWLGLVIALVIVIIAIVLIVILIPRKKRR